jgi:hypothetical protein
MNDFAESLIWTHVGREVISDGLREKISGMLERIELRSLPYETGLMQGMGIKAAIKEFRIPATHAGDSREFAPYGLYGVRGRYKNGVAEVFLLDAGTEIIPIASRQVSQ